MIPTEIIFNITKYFDNKSLESFPMVSKQCSLFALKEIKQSATNFLYTSHNAKAKQIFLSMFDLNSLNGRFFIKNIIKTKTTDSSLESLIASMRGFICLKHIATTGIYKFNNYRLKMLISEMLATLMAGKFIKYNIFFYVHIYGKYLKSAFNEMWKPSSHYYQPSKYNYPTVSEGKDIRFTSDMPNTLWPLDSFSQLHRDQEFIVSVFIVPPSKIDDKTGYFMASSNPIIRTFNKGRGNVAVNGHSYYLKKEWFLMTYIMQTDQHIINENSYLVYKTLDLGIKNCFKDALPGWKKEQIEPYDLDRKSTFGS